MCGSRAGDGSLARHELGAVLGGDVGGQQLAGMLEELLGAAVVGRPFSPRRFLFVLRPGDIGGQALVAGYVSLLGAAGAGHGLMACRAGPAKRRRREVRDRQPSLRLKAQLERGQEREEADGIYGMFDLAELAPASV